MKWVLFALLLPPFGDLGDRQFGAYDTAAQCLEERTYWEDHDSEVYRWTAK